jgi:hypothetical protein
MKLKAEKLRVAVLSVAFAGRVAPGTELSQARLMPVALAGIDK